MKDVVGIKKDCAKVLSVSGHTATVQCGCGSTFACDRKKVLQKNCKLRCRACFLAQQSRDQLARIETQRKDALLYDNICVLSSFSAVE